VIHRSAPGMRRLLWPLSVAVATVLAAAIGLTATALVYGRIPDSTVVVPVVTGVVVAALVAVLGTPAVRESIRAIVPSLHRAPSEISTGIAELSTQRLPTDELLHRAGELLGTGLDSDRVEIWTTGAGGGLRRRVALGTTAGTAVLTERDLLVVAGIRVAGEGWAQRWLPQFVLPEDPSSGRRAPMRVSAIADAGELLGMVVISRRPGAARYDRDDDDALAGSCRLLGAIVRNRQLNFALEESLADLQRTNAELQASRLRIVSAADAERRRIERDLHDGAQQHLLALAVTIGLVREMITDGEPTGEITALLDQLRADVRLTILQVRELAQGVYPALLMDSGLEPALRTAAGRSPLVVHVEASGVRRYPPDLEAALYFCTLEALQNAAKHASGADVTVRVDDLGDRVRISVADTGPGFDVTTPAAGMGRTTMADRVGALGGTVRWDSTPGSGTTVLVEAPVDHDVQ
jgi:signal transduction histidine kinase